MAPPSALEGVFAEGALMRPVVLTGLMLGSLVLAGCVSTTSNPEALRERHRQQCSDFGFEPDTDGFANCMMEQWGRAEDREAEDRRRTNEMIRENNRRAAQADAMKAQADQVEENAEAKADSIKEAAKN